MEQQKLTLMMMMTTEMDGFHWPVNVVATSTWTMSGWMLGMYRAKEAKGVYMVHEETSFRIKAGRVKVKSGSGEMAK